LRHGDAFSKTPSRSTQRETMKAGAKPIEVVRVRITDAGREAIEE